MRSLILSSLWLASQLVGSVCAFGTTVSIAVDYCPATTSTTPIDSTPTSTSTSTTLSTPSVEPGEPFYLSFSLNIDLRRDLVRQYLTPNGSTTTNPEDAVAFIITPGGQLMSGRGYLSTSPGVTSQRFQVLSNLLPISTLFTTSETGALQWENSLFADGKASCCFGDGVFVVFDGNLPPGCLDISLDPIPATDIDIFSSTTLSTTFSSATSSRPSTAPSSSTAATASFSLTATTAPTTTNPSATISSDTTIRTSTDPPSTTTPTYVSSTIDSTGTSPNPTASYPPGTVFGSLAYGVPNGCYISSIDSPAVFGPYTTVSNLAQCADFCADFNFFGVQAGSICACGPAVLGFLPGVCDVPCQGDPSTTCGGLSAAAVYEIVFRAGQQSSSSTNRPVSTTFLSTSIQSSSSSTTLFSTIESTSTTVASQSTSGHVTSIPSPSTSSSSLTSIEAPTSTSQSPTLPPTSPGTSSQTDPPATTTVVGGTCSTIAPSAALCPNYDHQAINVNRDGYCYEVYCQEGLAGLELEEDSTYAASLKDCISFCTLYNVAIPFGCLGVDYEEASLGQNCRLLSDISGTIPSVTRKAARLIYAGYPAVTDTSSIPSSLTTSSTSGATVSTQSTSLNSESKTSSSGSASASSTSNLGSQSSPSTPTTTNTSNGSSTASSVASVSSTSRSTTFGSITSATTGTATRPTTTSPGATSVASTITTVTSLTAPGATSTTTTSIVTMGTTTSTTTTTTKFANVIAPVAPSRYPLSPLCENGFESRFQGGQLLRAVERSRYYDIECSIDYNEPPNARFPFDLTTNSYVECADACDFGAMQLGGDERNCKAFSWVANTGECWLFNELTAHTLGSTVGIARRPGVHSGRYLYDEYEGLSGPQPGPNLQTYLRDPIPFPVGPIESPFTVPNYPGGTNTFFNGYSSSSHATVLDLSNDYEIEFKIFGRRSSSLVVTANFWFTTTSLTLNPNTQNSWSALSRNDEQNPLQFPTTSLPANALAPFWIDGYALPAGQQGISYRVDQISPGRFGVSVEWYLSHRIGNKLAVHAITTYDTLYEGVWTTYFFNAGDENDQGKSQSVGGQGASASTESFTFCRGEAGCIAPGSKLVFDTNKSNMAEVVTYTADFFDPLTYPVGAWTFNTRPNERPV